MAITHKWYGREVTDAEREGAARGLMLGAEHILEEARRLVPHDLGDLERDSGTDVDESALTSGTDVDESALTATVAFGMGAAAAYAVRQHEELTWKHDAGRQAKYLEQPVNDPGVKARVEELLAREIEAALG